MDDMVAGKREVPLGQLTPQNTSCAAFLLTMSSFGVQEGFRQAGFKLEVHQASELLSDPHGKHCASVLRERFPGVQVLDEAQRTTVPLPEAAKLVLVTPVCTNHSKLKTDRDPARPQRHCCCRSSSASERRRM